MSKLQVDDIVNKEDNGSVGFSRGAVVTGVCTATSFSGGASGDFSIEDKIIHTGDTNTALRFPAADTFTVETGGSEALRVDSSQNTTFGTTSESSTSVNITASTSGTSLLSFNDTNSGQGGFRYAHSTDHMQFHTADSEHIRLDSSGRLLIGVTASRSVGTATAHKLQVEAVDATAGVTVTRCAASTAGPYLSFGKSRAASLGDNTVVQSGDSLGMIRFAGADGTDTQNVGASIQAFVDGTPGSNDMPGRIVFSTSADGANTASERLRITSDGFVSIGVASPQSGAQLTIAGKGIAITGQNTAHGANSMRLGEEGSGLAQIRCYGSDASTNGSLTLRSSRSDGSNNYDISLLATGNLSISDGNLVVANGHGIDFSATGNGSGTMTSELLDDYEEGTFTPTINSFTTSGTVTVAGKYVKVGRQVTFGLRFRASGTIAYGVSCHIGGLPYAMTYGENYNGLVTMLLNSNSESQDSNKSGTQCRLDGEGGSRFFVGNFTTTSTNQELLFGGTYIAAS